ncbi:uncharacterized protein LOC144100575 isoform X2 [Amblyomma americanum]
MNRMTAVLPVILRARNSSKARDPTYRPPTTALTSVLCCQLPVPIGPCVLPAFGCVIPPEPFIVPELYEPELYLGLIYRLENPCVTLLIFASGKIVLTGSKTRDAIYEAFRDIYSLLRTYRIG